MGILAAGVRQYTITITVALCTSLTNHLDIGVAANFPARYRVRLVP